MPWTAAMAICAASVAAFRGDAGSQDRRREMPDFGRDIEHCKVPDDQHPFPRCARVSGAVLINDQLRDVNLERAPSLLPPLLGDLLVAGNDQISAGPRGEIASSAALLAKVCGFSGFQQRSLVLEGCGLSWFGG